MASYLVHDDNAAEWIKSGKESAEQLLDVLEGDRKMYFMNLMRGLSLLSNPIAAEIGGHGYITEYWEEEAQDWLICLTKLVENIQAYPLGSAPSEEQLLLLLNRMLTNTNERPLSRPLVKGGLVRCRTATGDLAGPYELVQNPEHVNVVESASNGVPPLWRLLLMDGEAKQQIVMGSGSSFEIAPHRLVLGTFPSEGFKGPYVISI